jgi:hypothetical protein
MKFDNLVKDALESARQADKYATSCRMAVDVAHRVAAEFGERDIDAQHAYTSVDGVRIVIKDHSAALEICGILGKLVGRKWERRVEDGQALLMYVGRLQDRSSYDTPYTITISGVEPGAGCRVEYEDVQIPARTVKRGRVVCDTEPDVPVSDVPPATAPATAPASDA